VGATKRFLRNEAYKYLIFSSGCPDLDFRCGSVNWAECEAKLSLGGNMYI